MHKRLRKRDLELKEFLTERNQKAKTMRCVEKFESVYTMHLFRKDDADEEDEGFVGLVFLLQHLSTSAL